MSREAPPEVAPVPGPPPSPHALLWLGLPLLGLALPFAYMFVQRALHHGSLEPALPTQALTRAWLAVSLAGALVLVATMAARRKGRTLWLVLDIVAGALPWVVALAGQSVASSGGFNPWSRRASVEVWGVEVGSESVVSALLMSHARGLGALMSGSLWAAAAVGWMLPTAMAPRWRGAGLVVAALPAWAVAYGFAPGASLLPSFGAALLSGVLLFAGTQASPDARRAGRSAILLATLAALALAVTATCETLMAASGAGSEGYFRDHAGMHAVMSAADVGAFVLWVPAALALPWLRRRGDPGVSGVVVVAQVAALVGILALDQVGTRLAIARVTPDPWPPWALLDVRPLPLAGFGGLAVNAGPETRFILAAGELRDPEGGTLARLDDAAALRAALSAPSQAWRAPPALDGPSGVEPWEPAPELGERVAIGAFRDVPAHDPPECPGRVLSLLLDRSLSVAELRAFVAASLVSDVAELQVFGPLVLSSAAKVALVEALRASGQEGAIPRVAADEQAFLDAVAALPATGFPPLEARRSEIATATFMVPSACWLARLEADSNASAREPDAAREELGEALHEMMPERPLRPARAISQWLDPTADVGRLLLEGSNPTRRNAWVIWTLDPPAP